MQVRQSIHSDHAKTLDTAELRREFLIEKIFERKIGRASWRERVKISVVAVALKKKTKQR